MGLFLSKDINTGLQISLRLIKTPQVLLQMFSHSELFLPPPYAGDGCNLGVIHWISGVNVSGMRVFVSASITENFRFMKKILWNIRRKLLLLYFGKQSMLERVIFHEDLIVTLSMTCTGRLFSVVIGQKSFLRTCCRLQILNLLDSYWCKI